jgi:hypothetical protein
MIDAGIERHGWTILRRAAASALLDVDTGRLEAGGSLPDAAALRMGQAAAR